jgi:hypothetical protein
MDYRVWDTFLDYLAVSLSCVPAFISSLPHSSGYNGSIYGTPTGLSIRGGRNEMDIERSMRK